MNFIDNGVTFKDILNAGIITGGPKIAKGKYKKDANNNITGNMPVVNAIDIDWNKAEIPGIDDPITSTGQLLSLIGELKQMIGDSGSIDPSILSNYATIAQLQELSAKVDANAEHTFEYHLTHVTANSNNVTSMKGADTVTLRFTASTGYFLPESVTVVGATFVYNKNNGTIIISNPTESVINITISTDDKRQCTFNTPTLEQLDFTITSGSKSYYVINDTFTGKLSIKSTADTELYGLPTSVSGTNCTISNYNATTGEFTIKCTGAGNMTISATPKDVVRYYFAVALETNSIFTVSGDTITKMNVANISTLEGAMSAIGQCPINFDNGFNPPASVNVEGAYVWFIIPSKYFNTSNFNFINGNNRYLLKQSNIQDLTITTKIKDCVSITTGKIPYTLVCVSNNGLGGKQEFKKL